MSLAEVFPAARTASRVGTLPALQNLAMLLNPKTIIRNVGGNQLMWLTNAFADGVGKCRAAFLCSAVPAIEKHVGAADKLAFVFAHPMQFAGIRRGGQANVDCVKVRKRGAVRVVNGTVALIGDD